MNTMKIGKQTVKLENPPYIIQSAAVVGVKEGEGPLRDSFDKILHDDTFGMDTWEASESKMQREAATLAMEKAGLMPEDFDYLLAGDLMNQCVATHYGIRDFNIPFLGLYGACSTMTESLSLASMLISAGYGRYAAAMTSSHFCSAEKQFRYPLEYGGQRPPTAQWTVTGSGCAIVAAEGTGPRVTHVTTGKIVDMGVTDINNMGSAMAPAAIDTLSALFRDTKTEPSEYDAVFTGDLGKTGSEILVEQLKAEGFDISGIHNDCGLMIFNLDEQDVHAGGSGCGCMGSVLCGHILKEMRGGKYKKIIAMATGALMNPTVVLQGESIPGIAHAVIIEAQKGR
ncbi:MAG: stage V sporulation protein AD [Clostridia bacterium]|nr:stage V sporulation protein AD [Clostridia bacterium]